MCSKLPTFAESGQHDFLHVSSCLAWHTTFHRPPRGRSCCTLPWCGPCSARAVTWSTTSCWHCSTSTGCVAASCAFPVFHVWAGLSTHSGTTQIFIPTRYCHWRSKCPGPHSTDARATAGVTTSRNTLPIATNV